MKTIVNYNTALVKLTLTNNINKIKNGTLLVSANINASEFKLFPELSTLDDSMLETLYIKINCVKESVLSNISSKINEDVLQVIGNIGEFKVSGDKVIVSFDAEELLFIVQDGISSYTTVETEESESNGGLGFDEFNEVLSRNPDKNKKLEEALSPITKKAVADFDVERKESKPVDTPKNDRYTTASPGIELPKPKTDFNDFDINLDDF